MQIEKIIKLLHNSSDRLTRVLKAENKEASWAFLRRESWLHLRLTLRLFIKTILR